MKAAKAIIVGLLIDIGATTMMQIVMAIAFIVYLSKNGAAQSEMDQLVTAMFMGQPWHSIISAMGCCISIFAGYYVAAKTQEKTYLYAGILGCISSGIALAVTYSYYSIAASILMSCLGIFSCIAGAWLWSKKHS